MKKLIGCVAMFATCFSLVAQSFQQTAQGLTFKTQGVDVTLQCYAPDIIRVIKSPEGVTYDKPCLSVVKRPEKTDFKVSAVGNQVTLSTAKMTVLVDVLTGGIQFLTVNGKQLFMEKPYGIQFAPCMDGTKASYQVRQAFLLDSDETIYGLGEHENGVMNQRNQTLELKNENMSVCIPMIQSIKGYGVFWDQYAISTFRDNRQELSMESVGACADYYFMYGGNADGVIADMRALTGQSPMLPLWAYGFFQSRERYKNQTEPVAVVAKYRELGVPLDCIIQDWQYWGKDSLWNAMDFNPETYPDPKGMVDKVHKMHAKMMIVAWPGFGPLTPQYKELKDRDMLINFDTWPPKSGTKPYDVYNPAARDIYWNYLSKGVFSKGFDAWWLDSSEPDHINVKEADFDQVTHLGTFRSVHNAFPLMTTGGVYDHWRAERSDKRVVILTRSAFAGQQRYAANTWSGDVSSTWEMLRKQIPAALNFSLCGIPYWNADIGGFFAGRYTKGGGASNPEFQELYVRWMQFATFTPMMRSHGTDIPREIYQFGKRGEWPFDAQEACINLRYALLPYLYSTAWEVTNHAGTFMRPLMMDFPQDKNVTDNNSEYLFGHSLLVAPVTEKGQQVKEIYLPSETRWYDFWTNEKTDGGKTVRKKLRMDQIPVYVRAGSLIPFGPKVQYATEKKWDNLEFRIYPGADGSFTLYEDENDNYNYEKGDYSEISFHWNDRNHILTIDARKGSFKGLLKRRNFILKVVDGQRKTVQYKGKQLSINL